MRIWHYALRIFYGGFSPRSTRRRKILRNLYTATNRYLSDLNIPYWLDCGTLLGWYRSRNILEHDKDVDFGMLESDFSKVWTGRASMPPGFKIIDTSYRHWGPKLFVSYRGFDADLYFYRMRDSRVRCLVKEKNRHYMEERPLEWFLPPKKTEFLGTSTLIPRATKEYLENLYGYLGADAVFNRHTHFWERVNYYEK